MICNVKFEAETLSLESPTIYCSATKPSTITIPLDYSFNSVTAAPKKSCMPCLITV